MNFARRRIRNLMIAAILGVITIQLLSVLELSLTVSQYYSGWLMVGLIVFLLFYYVKKRLSVLPLGRGSSWAQWHYYVGLYLLIVFFQHIKFGIPNGVIEIALASSLLFVAIIGGLGVWINRSFARRLAYLEEEVLYERIPQIRQQLKLELEAELLAVVKATKSATLSDYYVTELSHYFSDSRDFVEHVLGGTFTYLKRVNDLEQQMRYLSKEEAEFGQALFVYIEQKNMLDKHHALQGCLKYWGLLHAPIACAMTLLLVLHIVLVYAFRGAA